MARATAPACFRFISVAVGPTWLITAVCGDELVSLAEGWGSPEIAAQTDWAYRIRKDLGETRKLKWRSEAEREKFEAAEKKKYAEWNALIRTRWRA